MSSTKKQIVKFTLIGILAVLVDLVFYYLFLNILPEKILHVISNEALGKTMSFLCGMSVTYFFNKFWTWQQTNRSNKRLVKFSALYGISLLVNVSVNSGSLYVLHHVGLFTALPRQHLLAFLAATGTSAGMNFLGQKFWVFKEKEPAPEEIHDYDPELSSSSIGNSLS